MLRYLPEIDRKILFHTFNIGIETKQLESLPICDMKGKVLLTFSVRCGRKLKICKEYLRTGQWHHYYKAF